MLVVKRQRPQYAAVVVRSGSQDRSRCNAKRQLISRLAKGRESPTSMLRRPKHAFGEAMRIGVFRAKLLLRPTRAASCLPTRSSSVEACQIWVQLSDK
ncbi:hypothetical protein XavaCFBP5823_01005 [Xanthomonas axonopodis pv. vasculorum]|nr:hypothetical protein XavaCFBP5823_01005 [Xanthomonas axonopodis pv. vasculorum]